MIDTTTSNRLHACAARLALEEALADGDGDGFVVVYLRRSEDSADDAAEITRAYGVSPTALDELHAGNDGWFGLKEHLPAGESVEAVCRVIVDGPHGPPGDEACMYLEIVDIDGKPAIEVYS